jgi:hypothetical protein
MSLGNPRRSIYRTRDNVRNTIGILLFIAAVERPCLWDVPRIIYIKIFLGNIPLASTPHLRSSPDFANSCVAVQLSLAERQWISQFEFPRRFIGCHYRYSERPAGWEGGRRGTVYSQRIIIAGVRERPRDKRRWIWWATTMKAPFGKIEYRCAP